jgi:carbon monoxide dehydrogenase subunit G
VRLEQEFHVDAPVEKVWAFLMDVRTMAQCIPGASDVRQVDPTTYDATVKTKIGPISASFGCRINVLTLDEAARTGTVEVAGRDSKIGGGVKARMTMAMSETDGATTVTIVSDVDVLGKIGQYGHGMISKRADAMLAEFVSCAKARLE